MSDIDQETIWTLIQLEVAMKADLACADALGQEIMCRTCRNDFIQKAWEYTEMVTETVSKVQP